MNKEVPTQVQFLELAENALLEWSSDQNVKIHRIEFVVPFVLTDRSLAVWIFYESNEMVDRYAADGTTDRVEGHFLEIMRDIGYPDDYRSQISFYVDSHENVVANFEGNYFYRLR